MMGEDNRMEPARGVSTPALGDLELALGVPTPRMTIVELCRAWPSLAQDDQFVYFLLEAALGGSLFEARAPRGCQETSDPLDVGGSFWQCCSQL